jgi:HSP20 family protein
MTRFRFASPFDPVGGLLALQRELERVFDNPRGFDLGPSGRGVFPPMNVFRDDEGITIRMEVPGVAPEAIAVEARERTLTVSGARDANLPEGASYHRRERGVGRFSRSLQLPADVDAGKVTAQCTHGILTIRLPKREEAKPRQIAVQAA